jgi:hypothetical protein
VDDDGQIEGPLRASVGLVAMVVLACFVSAVAIFSNVCGLLGIPIWVAIAFGFVVLALLGQVLRTIPRGVRSWQVSTDRWDIAEVVAFVSFGLVAWRQRTGSWSFHLPSSQSVDMVHHLALSDYLSRTGHIPRGVIGYLGPMVGYPPGSHIFAVFVEWISRSEVISALTFTAWWICIAWGFFVGGITRFVLGEKHRWVGFISFPALCVASEFMLGQVSDQFYFAQIVGGFVFLTFLAILCLRADAFTSGRLVDGSKGMHRHQNVILRAVGMLLLAGLPAIYPLSLLSAGAVIGCGLTLVGFGWLKKKATKARSTSQLLAAEQADPALRAIPAVPPVPAIPSVPAVAVVPRPKGSLEWVTIEAGWLIAGALVGIGLWLPMGLATSNTMISQEGGLASPTLKNFGGPVAIAIGAAGLFRLARKAKQVRSDNHNGQSWSGNIVLVALSALAGQIALLSVAKVLGLPVTRYYVLKGLYLIVPLLLVVVVCGIDSWFEKMQAALQRTLGSPASTVVENRRLRLSAHKAGKGLFVLATSALVVAAWFTAQPLQRTNRSFDRDVVWLAQQARSKLPEQRLAVVTDAATSYLVWNVLFRQQRGDDPLATYNSFAATNRWANWPDNSSERYLLTTSVLAEQYLKNAGVRIAGIRGDAVLLSGEEQGRVRRVTNGALMLNPRKDSTISVTAGMRIVFPPSVSFVGRSESAKTVRKLLALPDQQFTNLPDRLVTEDGFRLLAMSRSQIVPLPAVLFAEALRVGQYDDRITAAITEIVAVTSLDLSEFTSEGAIDPATMFAWASTSPNERLINWRSQYLSLASAAQGNQASIVWSSLVPEQKFRSVSDGNVGLLSAAKACGAQLTSRQTMALRALSEILAQRTDLQTSFGTPSNPKLGVLIDWASGGSDSDASKLLPFWPELQVVAAACR